MKIRLLIAVIIALSLVWILAAIPKREEPLLGPTLEKPHPSPKRQTRKGPRKPPSLSVPISQPQKDPHDADHDSDSAFAPTQSTEEKLQQYFELLESINDPTPSQLLTLGELAFDANDSESAYEHYLEIIEEHPDDPIAPFALYKFAWVEYNLGDIPSAVSDMKLVLEWLDTGEANMIEMLQIAAPEDAALFQKKLEP